MKIRAALLSFLVLGLFLPLSRASTTGGPTQDGIASEEWVNLIGEFPDLENLKGRAVILHFFGPNQDRGGGGGGGAEGGLPQAYFDLIRKFHHEWGGRGLVVLGFCDESRSKLSEYMESYDIPYPVALRGSARSTFGVSGPNELVFLDRNGEIYWRGPNNGLWDGKLLKGMKGAKRLGDKEVLSVHLSDGFGKGVKKALDQCATGELAKALKTIETLLGNERTAEDVRAEAVALQDAITVHVTLLMTQIEACLEAREVLMAVEALEILAKELRKHDLGTAPGERLAALRADETLQDEIAAAEAYAVLEASYFKRGLRHTLKRIESFLEEYPSTRAAEKARNLIAGR